MALDRRRPTVLPLVLTTAAALSLSACIMPPALPSAPTSAPTSQPTAAADPVASSPAPVPSPQPTAAGELPDLLAMGDPLAPGTLAGWETSILTDAAFEVQPDSDFPAGPTISVAEPATDCTFWAYQGAQDSDVTDEAESSAVTLGILSSSSPSDWDPEADVFELAPSASQGVAVEFLSIVEERPDGGVRAWFARNFQASGSTSSIVAACPADAGGVDHIDEVVREHFHINFLQP